MPIECWFPSIVFYEDVEVAPAIRDAALAAIADRVAAHGAGDEFGLTADSAPNDLHLDPRVAPLLGLLQPALGRFLFETMRFDAARVEFHLGRCWPVVQRGNAHSGQVHWHRGSVFSGVFFLQAPPGSGAFALHKTPQALYDGLPKSEPADLTARIVTYEAVENRLLVFPSEMRHNRQANDGSPADTRIAIAFDLFALSDLAVHDAGLPRREAWRKLF